MKHLWAGVVLSGIACGALAAEPCKDNFTAEGNFLTGKTYKTWAVLPGVRQDDAFARAYAFTVGNGFTITSSSKEAGAISAQQSVSYGKGKSVPLGIVLQTEGSDTRIAISYATSGGLVSPEDAIKRHFCMTIAASATGSSSAAPQTAASAAPASPDGGQTHAAMRGYAMATSAQSQAYKDEVGKNIGNAKMRPLVTEAAPAIATFVGQLACLTDPSGASALNAYAAPGVDLQNRYVGLRPMRLAKYHDKGSCMSVARVHGWKSPANNALQFEVLYKADDSGETAKLQHEAIRQPDGTWLFSM